MRDVCDRRGLLRWRVGAMPTITGWCLSNREGRSARRTVPSRDLAPKSRHRSIALRGTRPRLSPERSIHANIVSHAGSPTPRPPKSMTALSWPRSTNRFPAPRSPWIQTSGPCDAGASRAAFHAAVTSSVSSMLSKLAIAARVSASRMASGMPPAKVVRFRGRSAKRAFQDDAFSISNQLWFLGLMEKQNGNSGQGRLRPSPG